MTAKEYLGILRGLYICVTCGADGEQVNAFEFG